MAGIARIEATDKVGFLDCVGQRGACLLGKWFIGHRKSAEIKGDQRAFDPHLVPGGGQGPCNHSRQWGRCQRRGGFLIGRSERQRGTDLQEGRAGAPPRSSQRSDRSPLFRRKECRVANATIRDFLLGYMEIFSLSSPFVSHTSMTGPKIRTAEASERETIWEGGIDFRRTEDLLPRLRTVSY